MQPILPQFKNGGQIVVIFAILLTVMMFFLAWIVDGGRIAIYRAEANRGAESGANAGLIIVGDQMLTQSSVRQTEASVRRRCIPQAGYGTSAPSCTATPHPNDIPAWLTQNDRATLVSSAIQTRVATAVFGSVAQNKMGSDNPGISEVIVIYPFEYDSEDARVKIRVRIHRQATVLLVGILDRKEVEVVGEFTSSLVQRK
jgi:hypothetical protein